MASKVKSSFSPASADEASKLARAPEKPVAQITSLPPSGSIDQQAKAAEAAERAEAAAAERAKAAKEVSGGTAIVADGPGTERAEHKPTLSGEQTTPGTEVVETRRRIRPEAGPDGPLPAADALEAAIDKGEKERVAKEAAAKATAEKEKAAVDAAAADAAKAKPAEKSAEAPASEAKPAVVAGEDEEEISDEELLQFLKPKSQRKFRRIAAENKELKTKLEAVEAEKKTLAEKALAPEGDPKAKEELETLRAETARYRRIHEIEADPEVKEKFDKPAEEAEAAITEVLKNYQIGDLTLNAIRAAGGFAEFSKSSQKFPVTIDGETQEMTAAELARSWMAGMKVGDVALLNTKLQDQFRARDGKRTFIATETKNAREHFAKRDADAKAAADAAAASTKKVTEAYDQWAETVLKEPWLQPKEIPANATDEEKKAIADDNEYIKQMRLLPSSVKNIKTVEDFQEIVVEALMYHKTRRDIAILTRENAALKAEVEKVRDGLKVTGKHGSIRPGATPPKVKDAPKVDPRTVDSAKALEESIERAEHEAAAGD